MSETNNGVAVRDLVVRVTKDPQAGVGKNGAGKPYFKMNLVNNDGSEAVWFSGIAFGAVANALAKVVKKGTKMKVTDGKVTQKEYQSEKTGKTGVENSLIVNAAIVVTDTGPKTIDEFTA